MRIGKSTLKLTSLRLPVLDGGGSFVLTSLTWLVYRLVGGWRVTRGYRGRMILPRRRVWRGLTRGHWLKLRKHHINVYEVIIKLHTLTYHSKTVLNEAPEGFTNERK